MGRWLLPTACELQGEAAGASLARSGKQEDRATSHCSHQVLDRGLQGSHFLVAAGHV